MKNIFCALCILLAAAEILSLFSFVFDVREIFFIAIAIIFFVVTFYNIEYGVYILLAEIFIGGKGYLFAFDIGQTQLSIRIAFFLIIVAIWILKKFYGFGYTMKDYIQCKMLYPLYALFIFLAYGLAHGLVKNSFDNVFFDFNAWLFFALIFVFLDIFTTQKHFQMITKILYSSVIWISVKSILVLYLFSHGIFFVGDVFYKWIRDTGVGEITAIGASGFRVFFQSHIYALIVFMSITAYLFLRQKMERKNAVLAGIVLYASSLAILISQSRSFWLAGVVTLACIFVFSLLTFREKRTYSLIVSALLIIIVISQFSVLNLITGNFAANFVGQRLQNTAQEPASSSRRNQLDPLLTAIKKNPIMGSGFGTEFTYKSNDPRILKENPSGLRTTYASEWGYLDIILKIGAAGFLAYVIFILCIIGCTFWLQNNQLLKSLIFGLIVLFLVHIFTPYLNHPLGIAYILIVSSFIINLQTSH